MAIDLQFKVVSGTFSFTEFYFKKNSEIVFNLYCFPFFKAERLLQQRTVALSAKSLKPAAALQYLHPKPSCTVLPLIQHHGDGDDDSSGDDITQKNVQ